MQFDVYFILYLLFVDNFVFTFLYIIFQFVENLNSF